MAIKTEYRLYFKHEADGDSDGTSLQISANNPDGETAVWLCSSEDDEYGHAKFLVKMTKDEALELKAILGVLTDTATSEEEVTAGVAS